MKDSKLVYIFKSFTAEEMKSFQKFIISPYFSKERDINSLFGIIKKNYPSFDSDELERENMFAKLFPGEEFSETKLKNMISVLSGLAEDFLVHNSLKLDPIFSQKILAKEYLERNNDKLFLSTIKSIENKT